MPGGKQLVLPLFPMPQLKAGAAETESGDHSVQCIQWIQWPFNIFQWQSIMRCSHFSVSRFIHVANCNRSLARLI